MRKKNLKIVDWKDLNILGQGNQKILPRVNYVFSCISFFSHLKILQRSQTHLSAEIFYAINLFCCCGRKKLSNLSYVIERLSYS